MAGRTNIFIDQEKTTIHNEQLYYQTIMLI